MPETTNLRGIDLSEELATSSEIVDDDFEWKHRFIIGVLEGFYGRPWTTEQRRHLFASMKRFGMNTYLYAPKDDLKHRTEWRQLYTPEETALILDAKKHNIVFVYALSPGIDIVYSNTKDVAAVKQKLQQVKELGCHSFALLFDDIEISMNESDKMKFASFAIAQLTISNVVFEYLGCPQFFFCPTEYCEKQAVPSLEKSSYLNIIGRKLRSDIHILWTGPRVVSRLITVEHIRRVAKILCRKPVIWDNLHANDYDRHRVFLGPYMGREVNLKQELSGVLTNPNCEYEANFVPIHTLACWNRSHAQAHVEDDTDATLEAGGIEPVADRVVKEAIPTILYHPLEALEEALNDWVSQFSVQKPAIVSNRSLGIADQSTIGLPPVASSCTAISTDKPMNLNSLTDEYGEPMEFAVQRDDQSPLTCDKMDAKSADPEVDDMLLDDDRMEQEEPTFALPPEYLSILIDLFYLPFENGVRARYLLDEFAWLRANAQVVRKASDSGLLHLADEWTRRSSEFASFCSSIAFLYRRLFDCPNRALVTVLQPYLSETEGIAAVFNAFVSWMGTGQHASVRLGGNSLHMPSIEDGRTGFLCTFSTFCSKSTDEDEQESADDESEPWNFGSCIAEQMYKLLNVGLKLELGTRTVGNFRLRPYIDEDRPLVYDLFRNVDKFPDSNCHKELDSVDKNVDFLADKCVAPFLDYCSPKHAFVLEEMDINAKRIMAFGGASLSTMEMNRRIETEHLQCGQFSIGLME